MKKCIRLLSTIVVVCLLISTFAISASAKSYTFTDEYGTWTYQMEEDGSITLLKCETAKKNIVIPATIDGKPVKKLGQHLFQNNDQITGVVIPHGIEEIEKMVFFNCDKLEHVEIPNSVTSIGDKVFSKCESLEALYIPASVTDLGEKVFEDSPSVEVQCPINSETAAYLKENKSDVANYTLIEVTTQNPVPQPEPGVAPEAPAPSNPSNPPVINGTLVTYTFGKTINGQPEFTFVVADSMPELDLMHYLVKNDQGGVYIYQSEEIREMMNNRFQLVSMSRYDGTNTEAFEFTQHETMLSVSTNVYTYLDEAGVAQADVLYYFGISIMDGDYISGLPFGLEFNSDNELLNYTAGNGSGESSMVEQDDIYTFHSKNGGTNTRYQAKDGSVIVVTDENRVNIHRFGVTGSCVGITIIKSINQEPSGHAFTNIHKEVVTYDSETKTTVDATNSTFLRADETLERQNGIYKEIVDNVVVEEQFYHANYDENGELIDVYTENRNEGTEEGTYEVSSTIGRVTEEWNVTREEHRTYGDGTQEDYLIDVDCEDTNRIVATDHVVRADGVQDAMSKVSQEFPNEPETREDHVSYRHVNTVDIHKEVGTSTNMETGHSVEINNLSKIEEMSDYTYIGDTGKFVGWDWTWNYNYEDDAAAADGDGVLTRYVVTEYKYSADTDAWTKTRVYATAKDFSTGSTIDFKDPDASLSLDQVMEDYFLNSQTYVFDPENSGMDNWRLEGEDRVYNFEEWDGTKKLDHSHTDTETGTSVNIVTQDGVQVGDAYINGTPTPENELTGAEKELVEEMPERMDEVTGIILGTSEVTAADGSDLAQNDVKEEILDWSEELKEGAVTEPDFFEETVTDEDVVADGEELRDLAEDIFDGSKLPETNVEGTIDHHHNDDGSAVTIINGNIVDQPAPAAETASESVDAAAESIEEAADPVEAAAESVEEAAETAAEVIA